MKEQIGWRMELGEQRGAQKREADVAERIVEANGVAGQSVAVGEEREEKGRVFWER